MRFSAKLGLTALMAALLLSALVSTASAGRLDVSNQNIRANWSRLEFASSAVTIRCQVTLEGSFHSRTITKTARTLIGAITNVRIKNESCTNGTAAVFNFPWHITYQSFSGSLPSISSIRIAMMRFRFQLRTLGLTCEYGNTTDTVQADAALTGTEVTGLTPVAGLNEAHLIAGAFCPAEGRLQQPGSVTQLNSTTRIRITLI